MFSSMEKGHHHPHRSVKAWSGAFLLAASLSVGRSHTGPKVWRGSFLHPAEPVVKTRAQLRLGGGAGWPLSRGFHRVEGSHLHPANVVGSYQLVIAP